MNMENNIWSIKNKKEKHEIKQINNEKWKIENWKVRKDKTKRKK